MWETASHLMLHCPYSQEIWSHVLYKLNLIPIACSDAYELLQSVTSRLDQQSEGALTLGKLLFNAFVWHIWAERNCRIFRATSNSSIAITQKIIQVATTRILYLVFSLPQNIQCHWNVPPNVQKHYARMISERRHGWGLSIVPTRQVLIGILWQDLQQPIKGRIEQLLNYYEVIFRIL